MPRKLFISMGIRTDPAHAWFLGLSRVHTSNGISIGSVVSAQLTVMSNRQTVTDHGISVINNRQRLHSDADRCNKKRPNQEVVRFTFVGIVDAVVDGVINARSRDAVSIRASIFRTHVTTLYYLATCTPTTHCRPAASGRLKTQVLKTKVPGHGICKYGIRKYEYARVENANMENASTNLQRWKT